MKNVSYVFFLFFLLQSSYGYSARECKTHKRLTIAQQLASLDPSFDLDLIDFNFFPGGSITAGYEYEVEPAFTRGLYFRTDRWQISTKIIPRDDINLEDGLNLNLATGLRHQTEATFIRSFADPCQAMLATPYTPQRIPLTVEKAIGTRFKKGDYFLFRSSLGFILSGDLLNTLGASWGISMGASYLVEGIYQLHIVRQDKDHVRMKIIAQRGRDVNGSVGVGYLGPFEVFKVGILDKQLKKFIETNPISVTATLAHDRVVMVDYVLNLSDLEVGKAFESLLSKVKNFRNIGLIAPYKNEKNFEANVVLDLTDLEDIYRRDFRQNNIGRLKRNLRASSSQDASSIGIKVGNKIIGYKWSGTIATSEMTVRQPDDSLEHFLLRSWDRNNEGRLLYSWFRSNEQQGMRALFTTDGNFIIQRPINLVTHHHRKRSRLPLKEFHAIKKTVIKALPAEVLSQIPWGNWNQSGKDIFTNFGFRLQIVLAPEVIINAPSLKRKEIVTLYRDHLKSKGLGPEDFFTAENNADRFKEDQIEEMFDLTLWMAAKKLERALDRNLPMLARLNALTDLRRNTIFKESGMSFIISLIPGSLKTSFHVDLNLSSNESQIDFEYGEATISSLYKKLLTIKAALDDDGLDILREAESLSMPAPYL